MKKTYKNKLPKGMNVEGTNVRVENGEVIVEVELKEEFNPKDGDFLTTKYDGLVFIYSDKPATTSDNVCAYCGSYDEREGFISTEFSNGWVEKKECRFATPEEKSDFLERLEKECHKKWNEEKKCLEDIRWEPKDGETYFYVNHYGVIIAAKYSGFPDDILRCSVGNCFKRNESAKKVAEQIKDIFKNSKAE